MSVELGEPSPGGELAHPANAGPDHDGGEVLRLSDDRGLGAEPQVGDTCGHGLLTIGLLGEGLVDVLAETDCGVLHGVLSGWMGFSL